MNDYFRRSEDLFDSLYEKLDNTLFSVIMTDEVTKEKIRTYLLKIINEDVMALYNNDPAARFNGDIVGAEVVQDVDYVMEYKPLQAVIDYRIANYLQYFHKSEFVKDYSLDSLVALQLDLRRQAKRISEDSKVQTAIEIHPAAQIGHRFVIDHGYGTIIGETSEIGDDCYILQGVVLGATGVKYNPEGRRHPKIGNCVEIAGGARIYGNITIGDHSIIYGNAIVTQDVPAYSQVRVTNQIQITTPCESGVKVYGVVPEDNGVCILGACLGEYPELYLCNSNGEIMNDISYSVETLDDCKRIRFDRLNELKTKAGIEQLFFMMKNNSNQVIVKNSIGWREFVQNIKK